MFIITDLVSLSYDHSISGQPHFTAMKIQDLIFSRERNRKIQFSQYGLREATLYGISVSFLRETTIGVSYFY